ncbi:MAG: peptidoglycan-binding protein [Christensenellales bacterium]
MKRTFLSLLLAVCFGISCCFSAAAAQQAVQPSSALASFTHNCPNTAIMRPEAFDPMVYTYLLTVANWVSRVTLTPVSQEAGAIITINGVVSPSGQASQVFEMTDEPLTVLIAVVSSGAENSLYTVYLQRRPSSARTGVAAGFLTSISQEDGKTFLIMDLVTVSYQGDHVSSFSNDNVAERYKYPAAEECRFYYGDMAAPVLAKNAGDFQAHVTLSGTELFSVIYVNDEIVSVQPFSSELKAISSEPAPAGFISVTPAPDGSGILLRENYMGAPVIKLQQALKARDLYKGEIDGLYGAGLREAVKAFQLAYALSPDGIAGADTQRLLYEGVYPARSAVPASAPAVTPIAFFVMLTAAPDGTHVTLKEGDGGALVKTLQQALKDQQYYKGEVDGLYGQETTDAVMAFQSARNLTQDGMAGIDTQSVLYGDEPQAVIAPVSTFIPFQANVTPVPNGDYVTLVAGNIGALVIALQQRLKDQGFYTGEIDGMYGAGTKEAVMNFQRENGLEQDGEASPAMLRILYEGKFPEGAQVPGKKVLTNRT